MRKSTVFILIVALLISPLCLCFANEQPRDAAYESAGKTVFTNISVVGLDQEGLPGYIELLNPSGTPYYIWVDNKGKLRIASPKMVGYQASPQSIVSLGLDYGGSGENGWRDASGQIVGEQAASKGNIDLDGYGIY